MSNAQLFPGILGAWTHPVPGGCRPRSRTAWRAFVGACHAFFAAIDAQLQRDTGIPLAYYEILVRLSEAPGHTLRMSQLAEAASASKSRVSHAVARLEERGWVRRRDCPTDRRGQLAELTDEGYAVLVAAAPGHVEHVRRTLFDPLTPEQVQPAAGDQRGDPGRRRQPAAVRGRRGLPRHAGTAPHPGPGRHPVVPGPRRTGSGRVDPSARHTAPGAASQPAAGGSDGSHSGSDQRAAP